MRCGFNASSNAFEPLGQSVPSLIGLRVAFDIDELAGFGIDELAATDGAVGAEAIRDSRAAEP